MKNTNRITPPPPPPRTLTASVLVALLVVTGITHAQDKGVSVATRLSTLGIGIEFKYPFHEKFNGRLMVNQYDKSADETREGNRYEGDLELSSYGLIGDWHPTGGGFRLSAGLLSNGNELKARTADGDYEFGDGTYTGNASVTADFKSLAPYVGLGWSSQKSSGWSFDFEVGAMFQGAARLSGRGMGMANGTTCNFSVNDNGDVTAVTAPCSNGNVGCALDRF